MDKTLKQESTGALNSGQPGRKRVRYRIKMDDGRKKKQRRQNIVMALIVAFILGLILAAYVLYKMDANSAPQQVQVVAPAG